MSSLYADYIREREGKSIIETSKGFITYLPYQDGLYIESIYISPDFRFSGEASKLTDQVSVIAKEQKLSKLYGSVSPAANNATDGLKAMLAYGFKLHSSVNNLIMLVKEI